MTDKPETQLTEIDPDRFAEFTEVQLVELSRMALNACHFTIGAAASIWCTKYARGRTDADFGRLIGMTADQIYERRRVWERFGVSGLYRNFPGLDWSHYRINIARPDAPAILEWAADNKATIDTVRVYRRQLDGKDLNTPDDDDDIDDIDSNFGVVPPPVKRNTTPAEPITSAGPEVHDALEGTPDRDPAETKPTTSGDATDYSPFRKDAATPPEREPSPNQKKEAARVADGLKQLDTIARKVAAIGSGRWYDLLRDHLDNLAECARQHETPTGLDKAAIASTIHRIQNT